MLRRPTLNCVKTTMLAMMLISGTVWADPDWKTYPATKCVAAYYANFIDYDAYGGVCNKSQYLSIPIYCPVVRDLASGFFPIRVRHSGRSGNYLVPLACELRNMHREAENSGTAMEHQLKALKLIHEDATPAILSVETILETVSPKAIDYGAHVMRCNLPPTNTKFDKSFKYSCLYNYSINEHDGQGNP